MEEEENYAEHPHMPLLRAAYVDFRAGHPQAALDRIEPVLLADAVAQLPSLVSSLLWALAGDAYFKLGRYENGFIVYRKALELDPTCGCLALFAREVANHQRFEDAEFALKCLDVERVANRTAWKNHFWHVLWHSLDFDAIWFRLAILPRTRRRLRRLAIEHRNVKAFDPR